MKISALRFVFVAFVSVALSLSAWAQIQAGQIKAARVENEVLRVLPDGTTAPIRNGQLLTETDVISTGRDASVVLVFMNGSSIKLGANSRLAIDEFKMDPLEEDLRTDGLTAEPSVSKTTLNLTYGEMVGDVKKLNTSSTYSIKTPVGAAGIRGTIFRVVYRPDGTGKAFFTVSTAEGKVVMEGVTTGEIPIDAGKEVVVTIDLPDGPGDAVDDPAIVTQDISPATAALIQSATDAIIENFGQVFAAEVTAIPTPPPRMQAPLPELTPGAGR